MRRFRNRYRIPSARLQSWDYTREACYFVTICTGKHVCHFGEIVEGEMVLSPVGRIVGEQWQRTSLVRPNVGVDEWQMMPNHLHGIIIIGGSETPQWAPHTAETARRAVSNQETFQRNVSTGKGGLKAGSLGSIVGQFKAASTKRIWGSGARDFAWQTRFYDHIIRNQGELDRIREYIKTNPLRWACDRYHPALGLLVRDEMGHAVPWQEM